MSTHPGLKLLSRDAPPTTWEADATLVVEMVRFRDLRAVAELQRRCFRTLLAYRLSTLIRLWFWPGAVFLVARVGPGIVGCVIGDMQAGRARVINICVDPVARRRGVGAQLLRAIEDALPEGDVVLMVEDKNASAQRLYTRAGFEPVGRSRGYYGSGQDGVWMLKRRSIP